MALKDAYILAEAKALGAEFPEFGPHNDSTPIKGQAFVPTPMPGVSKRAVAGPDTSGVRPGTLHLTLEEWHLLADALRELMDSDANADGAIDRIRKSVQTAMLSMKVGK